MLFRSTSVNKTTPSIKSPAKPPFQLIEKPKNLINNDKSNEFNKNINNQSKKRELFKKSEQNTNKTKTKNFDIMVGCMVGTSLAMAPALILAQNVKWVDLDGPLLMSEDRKHNLIYKNSEIQPASTELWG